MILLDTDILIDILRNYSHAVEWLSKLDDSIAISGFTALELIQGCENKQEVSKIQKFISGFHIIWLDAESSNQAIELFAKHRLKSNIGLIDILIAQVSIKSGLALHTFNIKHYKSIPDIKLIQPYKK